jgi:adenine-specific DNA-methyltransferase
MKLKNDNSEQKLRGSYYTPPDLSNFLVDWTVSGRSSLSILEPSCGDGVFIESLLRHENSIKSCQAIELDSEEARKAEAKAQGYQGISVHNGDFFEIYQSGMKKKKFDAVVGNPPYIRYQYLTPGQREIQSKILVSYGMKSNKLINTWVSFLVACVGLLNENGRIGMVIPAELLQVAYANDLRRYLVDNLSAITIVTFVELVFPDVQQEVILLLGEKCISASQCEIRMMEFQDTQDLIVSFPERINEYKPVTHHSNKWTKYFLSIEEIAVIDEIGANSKFLPFRKLADVDIGITTGSNKYFSVDQQTVAEFELEDVVLPLIGRSSHADGLNFTKDDWQNNIDKNVQAYLINFPDIPFESYPAAHRRYIKGGEDTGINKGYKCGIRNKWYRVPSIWVPDAFFLRRNNTFPKFVLNKVNAVSTDTMHRIKIKDGVDGDKIVISYYNSVTLALTELEARSYGGGVLEILPGELERVLLPDLKDFKDTKKIKHLLQSLDVKIRQNQNIESVLDEIDQAILIDFLGISIDKVQICRAIWKKLMNRRLGRKAKRSLKTRVAATL